MSFQLEIVLRLLLASALAATVGYQRETAGKAAGLRTHVLIGMGAALFTIVSMYGFAGSVVDPSRVAAGVVVGVGFIGAGVIFRGIHSEGVAGLTSASCLWVTAAVGLAVGVGLYLLAIMATLIAVIVLSLPKIKG